MSILSIILAIVIVGILLWAINTYLPIDEKIKKLLNIVVVVCLVLWLLRAFGVFGYLSEVRI